MGGRAAQPIDLILAKGKSHVTKAEIEERKSRELKIDLTDVKPPSYLTAKQKKDFNVIAEKLLHVGIISELDEDTLARYLVAQDQYLETLKLYKKMMRDCPEDIDTLDKISRMQDRYAKQCRTLSTDLGMTITSRVKLVVPTVEQPKENKFMAKFGGGKTG